MSRPTRVLVVCPGRGSYDRACLGQLQDRTDDARAVIDACDAWRSSQGRPTLTELDAKDSFRQTLHVAGEHASLLTMGCGLADLAQLDTERYEIVGVTGNSMGWYTALGAAGALSLSDTIRLVDTMGWYQKGNVLGGQILYPVTDSGWDADPALCDAVEQALNEACAEGHGAWWSIRLGGFAVLGADKAGVKFLMGALPKQERGSRTFPIQLPMHSAFHTPLMQATSDAAFADLQGLEIRPPTVPLIDGRGQVFRPLYADPVEMLEYTLGHQVVQPYDFTKAIETALQHCAPELVVVLGPGNSLGGPLARILVSQGWRGILSRADLDEMQSSNVPQLLSLGVTKQRDLLVRG